MRVDVELSQQEASSATMSSTLLYVPPFSQAIVLVFGSGSRRRSACVACAVFSVQCSLFFLCCECRSKTECLLFWSGRLKRAPAQTVRTGYWLSRHAQLRGTRQPKINNEGARAKMDLQTSGACPRERETLPDDVGVGLRAVGREGAGKQQENKKWFAISLSVQRSMMFQALLRAWKERKVDQCKRFKTVRVEGCLSRSPLNGKGPFAPPLPPALPTLGVHRVRAVLFDWLISLQTPRRACNARSGTGHGIVA